MSAVALALPRDEERQARARLRALKKARRVRQQNTARRHRAEDKAREQFRGWVQRERAAYALHVADPEDAKLLRTWRKTLREMPSLYGRHEEQRS